MIILFMKIIIIEFRTIKIIMINLLDCQINYY